MICNGAQVIVAAARDVRSAGIWIGDLASSRTAPA
jgi:hypothetical protein